MNKIKVLYDVFKTMKDKDQFKGDVKIEATLEEKKVFSFTNEFVTDNVTGATKATISTEVDYKDNQVKHESTTEFNIKNAKNNHRGHFMKSHEAHHGHRGNGSMKDKLSHITFALNILNELKVEEVEDKTLLSLNLKEIINQAKAMKADFHERVCEEMKADHKAQHAFAEELLNMEPTDAELKVWVNKECEVEKIEVVANGDKKENFKLLLQLIW